MAITRAQQVRQMLEDGGMLVQPSMTGKRPGYRNPNEDRAREEEAAANRREAAMQEQRRQTFDARKSPTGSYDEVGLDVRKTGKDDDPYEGTTQATGTDFVTNLVPDVNIPDRDEQKKLKKKLREKNPTFFDRLLPTRQNFFNRSLLIPGAKKSITKQRQAYADYLRSMGVIPSEELTDTDNLFSFFENQAFQEGPTVPVRTIKSYGDFLLDEFGNPTVKYRGDIGAYRRDMGIDDRGPSEANQIATDPTDLTDPTDPTDPNQTTDVFAGITPRFAGSIFDFDALRRQLEEESAADGGRIGAAEGGIMDLETGRQMYFLGKLVKKATRAVKKVAKSPIGKAALGFAALKFGPAFLKSEGLKNFFLTDPSKGFSLGNLIGKNLTTKGAMAGIAGISALAGLMPQEEEEDDPYRGPDIDIANIRANPYNFLSPRFTGTTFAADGGRIGLKDGNGVADEEAENARFAKRVRELMDEGFDMGEAVREAMKEGYAEGGRTGFFMGSKLPQGLALVRQMLKFFSEGSKTGKTGSELLKIVNPKQFTKYLEDPNTLFMKGSTKDGIMASDVVKDYASKVKGERAKMIEDLLVSAKNINKADKSTEKFKKEIIEEMMSKGSNKEAAESSAEIFSDMAKSAAGGKEIMKNKPKITDEGILQLEQIVKNLQTGGKTARDLNADGGRIGLKGGTGSKILNFFKPFSRDTKGGNQLEGLLYGSEGIGEILRLLSSSGMFAEGGDVEPVAKKTMPLLDMDGKEMDLRDNGGFVPIGRMEKADDVPARLSKNEFVFTADAVRNAGEGDVDKGAEVMYNMMKNLESGGEVSEESQGLQGAREMFQTSKRLEEVL